MKIKKINALVVGCIFALAMILNQLINFVVGYLLGLLPRSVLMSLGESVILAKSIGILLLLIMGFLLGALLALVYNLMAKSKRCQLILETDNKK